MSGHVDDQWQVKSGAAVLAVCFVRTLQQSDPDFQGRFIANLDRAYNHYRDNHGLWRRGDGKPREIHDILEMLGWTQSMLTGWDTICGQGEPLIPVEQTYGPE